MKITLLRVLSFILFINVGCKRKANFQLPDRAKGLENLTVFPEDPDPMLTIDLLHEIRVDDTDLDNNFFGGWTGIEVDDQGRIYIGDFSGHSIIVIHPAGYHETTLGREGSGPGEFRMVGTMKIIDDHIYVRDAQRFTMTSFSLDTHEVRETINMNRFPDNQDEFDELLEEPDVPRQTFLLSNGTYLAGYFGPGITNIEDPLYNLEEERYRNYYIIDSEWVVSHKLFDLREAADLVATVDGQHRFNLVPLPFLGNSLKAISNDGYIYTAWSEDFLIKAYGPSGYKYVFYYPYQRKSLYKEEAISLFSVEDEWNRGLIEHAELPETWPALHTMIVDDEDRLWVSTFSKEEGMLKWWILKSSGELISTFNWPMNRSIVKVKNNYLYTRETDEMEVVSINRYRIEME